MAPQPMMQTRFMVVGPWSLVVGLEKQVPRFARNDKSKENAATRSFSATFSPDVRVASLFLSAGQSGEDAVRGVVRVGDDDAARVERVLERGADGVQRSGAAFSHALGAVVAMG